MKTNEITEVVENAVEETMNEASNLNAKDVAITAGLGAVVVGVVVLVVKAIKGKKIQFKNPFAKKTKVEEIVEAVEEKAEELLS